MGAATGMNLVTGIRTGAPASASAASPASVAASVLASPASPASGVGAGWSVVTKKPAAAAPLPPASLAYCENGYDPYATWAPTEPPSTTVLDGGSVGAQVAYGSYPFSQYAKLAGGSGAAAAGFFVTTLQPAPTPDAGDAGDASTDAATDAGDAALADAGAPVLIPVTKFIPVAAPITYGQVLPTTSVVPVSGLTFDSSSGVAFTAFAADGGSGASVGVPFPSIQAISYPGATTAEFANGVGYVFVLVGTPLVPQFLGPDGGAVPSADAGTFNPLSPHILGFPPNPPFGN